ncbi:MAG: hypothetical protein IIA49_05100 [Bacteroidetes bacterium]|nr:hypothetical protein [Bacteroidota bacterium]
MKIGIHQISDDLFSNIRDGIILMDNEGKILQINKSITDRLKTDYKDYEKIDKELLKNISSEVSLNKESLEYIKTELKKEFG